ncbi:MAG: hypothetical protein LBI68_07695 [Azoarcus sp.]|nr:hypothetical protein [Azoarcus sp.]
MNGALQTSNAEEESARDRANGRRQCNSGFCPTEDNGKVKVSAMGEDLKPYRIEPIALSIEGAAR